MDPGCEVVWSRPVDGTDGTSLRYLIFSKWPFCNRDFYCVCRCAKVIEFGDMSGDTGSPVDTSAREQYVYAVMSLLPELLAATGLPESNKGIQHGSIYISGIVITDNGKGGCLVEVMADVDPASNKLLPSWIVDAEVRLHVLHTAERIAQELAKRD